MRLAPRPWLAALLCLLMAAQILVGPPPPLPATPSRQQATLKSATSAVKMPCCCRPGHCHMAMCHGNPDFARTQPGLMTCGACACGPAPHPTIPTSGGGHRLRLLACSSTGTALPLLRQAMEYPHRPVTSLRVHTVSPPELPPRAG